MAPSSLGGSLTWPDYAVLVLSLACLVAIGGAFTRQQRNTADFFLARRRIPWWAACLSFLATEISAVTIISVPATAYSENWEYAQFFVGSSLAKLAVAVLFIPAFYRYDCVTIYEFLKHRFGAASQVPGSIFFFITRLLGSGVRLMAAALAVSVLVGWPLWATITLFTAVSIAYIAMGGVKAVVWTNVFQAGMFLVGGLPPCSSSPGRCRAASGRSSPRHPRRDGSPSSTGGRRRAIRTSGGACSRTPTSSGSPSSMGTQGAAPLNRMSVAVE